MNFQSKIQSSLKRWSLLLVILFSFNIGFARSVIVHQIIANDTCPTTTYLNEQMYQCELTLHAHPSQKLMLNFNQLELNCSDTLYVYDGPNVFGNPAFKLTCENDTGTMIYSTTNSLTLEYLTADSLGFNSNDFLLAYAPFNDSLNDCDGFVCRFDGKYCISSEFVFDGYFHCEDRTDELSICFEGAVYDRIKLSKLICIAIASFILLLGIIWLCVHIRRKVIRNRAVINRNEGNLNEKLSLFWDISTSLIFDWERAHKSLKEMECFTNLVL